MKLKTIKKQEFSNWIDGIIKESSVAGVVEKETGKFEFAPLPSAKELRLDHDVTILPPKKYLQPPRENLFQFKCGRPADLPTCRPVDLIIGIHPYDMRAIDQMDAIFAEDNRDANYMEKRANTLLIGCDPSRAGKWSFWSEMGTSIAGSGFDLWLTDIGDRYLIEVGTKKGEKLLKTATVQNAEKPEIEQRNKLRQNLGNLCAENRKLKTDVKDLSALFKINHEHKIWEERAKKCYSCGSCNLVCPTCYCFDVRDEMDLDLANGRRVRVWDGCLLEEFAKVASGENFREEPGERFRHRLFRKMVYMPEKIGALACVGCGRCASVCLPDIADPVKIVNELNI